MPSLNDTVRLADAIVLGTITDRQSRWVDISRRRIVTEYVMTVEDVVYRSDQGPPIRATIVLPYWGGTIGDETHSNSVLRLPSMGERLVVMLRPGWNAQNCNPIAGVNSGLFTVGPDHLSGEVLVREVDGPSLALTTSGQVRRRTAGLETAPVATLETFIEWLRKEARAIKATPFDAVMTGIPADPRVLQPVAKVPDGSKAFSKLPALPSAAARQNPSYVLIGAKPDLPVEVNEFPSSFGGWYFEDVRQMMKWNYYIAAAFSESGSPTSTWSHGDGVFDLTGWPSSADLAFFGLCTWEEMGDGPISRVLAVANGLIVGSTIVESDVSFNPAHGFTLNDEWALTDSGDVHSFRWTMVHELGHVLGLSHDFTKLGVMNYPDLNSGREMVASFGFPYMDDIVGVRSLFPTRVRGRTDLGVHLYRPCVGTAKCFNEASFFNTSVLGPVLISNYSLENVGTTTIATPTVEWYLTTQRNFTAPYYLLGSQTYPSMAPGESLSAGLAQSTFQVPQSVPVGDYFLAGYVPNDGGPTQTTFPFGNDFAFSRSKITVNPVLLGFFGKVSPGPTETNVPRNVTLNWTDSQFATGYEFCIDMVDNSECDTGWNPVGPTLSVALNDLNPLTEYFWQVQSVNGSSRFYADGMAGAYYSFTTEDGPPGYFAHISPAWEASTSPVLQWTTSVGATGYEYCVDTQNNGTCDAPWIPNGMSTSAALTGLTIGIEYCWTVRSSNAMGTRSMFGAPCFTAIEGPALSQLGPKLVGTGASGLAFQGGSVAVSADGRTAIVGGANDAGDVGAAWIWTRNGETWTQQGPKLVGSSSGAGSLPQEAPPLAQQGAAVALSGDGNTAAVGGPEYNDGAGAVWMWKRTAGSWAQDGPMLIGSGAAGPARQGASVSLSADGDTLVVGGPDDDAVWVWTRIGGVWTQQGLKLVGLQGTLGMSVAISGDGNTVIAGAPAYFNINTFSTGAVVVWGRSGNAWIQQGPALTVSGTLDLRFGEAVALSHDGDTAIVGAPGEISAPFGTTGAAHIWQRNAGVWSQQGPPLVAPANAPQAFEVSISGDGKRALVGATDEHGLFAAVLVWARRGNMWMQQGLPVVGAGGIGSAGQPSSVAFDADGRTGIVGGFNDTAGVGAAWVFASPDPLLVDLNGDGGGDAFTYDASTGAWSQKAAQSGSFVDQSTGAWNPGWSVLRSHFNGDLRADFFLYNTTSGQWAKLLNNGTSFTTQSTGGWWPGWERYAMDLDGDGITDFFLYDPATGVWFKAVSTPTGFTYTQGGWNPGWEIYPMTLNSDALGDMFLINRTTGRWFWVQGQNGPSFTYPVTETWFPGWQFYPGDFSGDGLSDILLHDPATGTYFVAANTASGFSYVQGGWSLGWQPYVADFDADGKDDLFLHDPATGVWFEMLSDGAGNFVNAGGQTWSLGWQLHPTDFDGDGRADMLLYDPTTGAWYQARNLVDGAFTYTSGAWPSGLSIAARAPIR